MSEVARFGYNRVLVSLVVSCEEASEDYVRKKHVTRVVGKKKVNLESVFSISLSQNVSVQRCKRTRSHRVIVSTVTVHSLIMKLRNLFFLSILLLSKESAAFIVVHDRSEHVMEKNSKCHVRSFTVDGGSGNGNAPVKNTRTVLHMAQISQKDAQSGIDKVVKALQNDRRACDELGKPTVF